MGDKKLRSDEGIDRASVAELISSLKRLLESDERMEGDGSTARSISAEAEATGGEDSAGDPLVMAYEQWRSRFGPEVAIFAVASAATTRVAEIIRADVDNLLKPLGLTVTRYEVLQVLAFSHSHALRLGKISQRLMMHPASITSMVDKLQHAGLIRRVPDPSDGRTTLAQLTQKGEETAMAATEALVARRFGVLSHLDEQQALEVFALMQQVRAAAGDPAADLPGSR